MNKKNKTVGPMQNKPLLNVGEVMPPIELPSLDIPDFSAKSAYNCMRYPHITVSEIKLGVVHKIVFVVAKAAKVLHRRTIASEIETPLANIAPSLSRLKNAQVIVSPAWGYYTLGKDFLCHYQIAFGEPSLEKLLKMFDDGGIDLMAFGISLDKLPRPLPNQNMGVPVKLCSDNRHGRLVEIHNLISNLTNEQNSIVSKLMQSGQDGNSTTVVE